MLDKLSEAKVNELVERFLKVKDIKKSEEHIQSLFTIKMLEYLGWSTDDFKINQGQDVNTGKKPDIILHSSGNTLLVIESKDASKLSMLDGYYQQKEIKLSFVEQLQKYCIAEGVSWGILTNFIEWRVYAIFQNRLYMNRKYAFHKLLWENADKKNYCDLQSAEGSIFLEKLQKHEVLKTKGQWDDDPVYYPVQEDIKAKFFSDLKEWRSSIHLFIKTKKPHFDEKLNDIYAQKLINRMIFIDYCADNRIISQDRLHAILHSKSKLYKELNAIFTDMDEKFNSELFAKSKYDEIEIDDATLGPIINGLSNIDFSKLSVHVIGEVYEKYLGEIQRSGQGVYYTPEHIVDFIVENTVGVVLSKCKTIQEVEAIKVIDPACGSGSFLIRVFEEFLTHYKRFENNPLFEFELRKRILQKNIYGVDLDERAIEIAKLNLLVKALEGAAHFNMSGRKMLPNIKLNIRCGNSLVSGSMVMKGMDLFRQEFSSEFGQLENLHSMFEEETDEDKQASIFGDIIILEESLNRKLNINLPKFQNQDIAKPFNFEVAYPKIVADGGFHCVIGNPPYIDSELMTKEQADIRTFISKNMEYTKGNWDIYIAFFEKANLLSRTKGYYGYITPDKWISKPFGEVFRMKTCKELVSLTRVGREVFSDAKVDAVVSIFNKKASGEIEVSESTQNEVQVISKIKKAILKPQWEYDFLFSKHIDILLKLDNLLVQNLISYECENACATSDCYILKDIIEDIKPENYKSSIHYKIINTGTIGKYAPKWSFKAMRYLKDDYLCPVAKKKIFISTFPNSYGQKAAKPKLILKGLTLLDASIDYDGEIIPGKSTLIVTTNGITNLEYLSALFNSKLAYFYISQKYPSSSYNEGITFTKDMIANFPAPCPTSAEMTLISKSVKDITAHYEKYYLLSDGELKDKLKITIDSIQRDLDALIYKIYSLTTVQIAIIENLSR